MQAKKRYILLMSCCAFLSLSYFGYYHWKNNHDDDWYHHNLSSYMECRDIVQDTDIVANPRSRTTDDKVYNHQATDSSYEKCRMETCFDFSRCDKEFKVYVYPTDENLSPSVSYRKVLNVMRESKYYTSDPNQACLFVLSLDTLDRDSLSKDYVRNMPSRIKRLQLWNGGQNHIIFNLYSGTWPDYSESLGFDVGKALLAKASFSVESFRPRFDISLPLFHKTHPEKVGEPGLLQSNHFPGNKNYLLAFKGKRYVYGIGSETRNSLYHLHNDRDIILVTTCKHGGSWKEFKDERCDGDNAEYERHDYNTLLHNSSFCLVPRGRRLGSFRFLEVLQAGCIPVLVANGLQLPFFEVIDWDEAVVWGDERLLLQVPDMLRSIPKADLLWMRQQTQVLWNQYFSSVQSIILTTLQIIQERISTYHSWPSNVWNTYPGVLAVNFGFSDYLPHYPFYFLSTGAMPSERYSALVYVRYGWTGPMHSSPLYRLIKNITKSKFVEKIFVLWLNTQQAAPSESRLPGGIIPVDIITAPPLCMVTSATSVVYHSLA